MITIKQVEKVHTALIEQFGGADGMRDFSTLESALARPTKPSVEMNYIPQQFIRRLH